MPVTIGVNQVFADLDPFFYRAEQPTYYTELLSFRTLKLNALIGEAGGKVLVETSTPSEQEAAASQYLADFKTWLDDTSASVTTWLLEEDESRALPAIIAPPALTLLLSGAVVLWKGALVKMGIDAITTIIRTVLEVQAARRSTQIVRMLDKAFFKSSWWGLSKESWLERIANGLTLPEGDMAEMGLSEMLFNLLRSFYIRTEDGVEYSDPVNMVDMLIKICDKPENIRLLLQAVLSHGGNIDNIEFDVLPGNSG